MRLHNCDAAPISADHLEKRVVEAMRMVLGDPDDVNGLIRIMRDQAEKLQTDAVARLQSLIEQDREVSRKLDNAVEAVLSGLNSPTIQSKIKELETQKAEIARDMKQLKASVDASMIPENRLRELLNDIIASEDDAAILLSAVARVEVTSDSILIWTLLDADPTGTIDYSIEGVTITPGVPSGVPNCANPNPFFVKHCFGFVLKIEDIG